MHRLLLIVLLSLLVLPSHAQEDDPPDPFITALHMIPDTDATRGIQFETGEYISFVNYRALENARENAYTPADTAEFRAWEAERDDDPLRRYDHWFQGLNRINSGPDSTQAVFRAIDDMPQTVGFDWFDIDSALGFGVPPAHGNIFIGDFDAEAIGAAHAARDYTETTLNGVLTWMTPGGIDEALTTNIDLIYPSNIFDPRLGRRPPVLITDDGLASAFAPDIIRSFGATLAEEAPSLYDAPDISALTDALMSYDATLIQSTLLGAETIYFDNASLIENLSTNDRNIPDDIAEYGILPRYEMVGFADLDTGEEQIAVVGLLYSTEDTATIAAAELEKRIPIMDDALSGRPDIFGTYQGEPTRIESRVYTTDAYAVALVGIYYPRVQEEALTFADELPDDNTVIVGGFFYRDFIRAWAQRTFYALGNFN